MIFGKFVTFTEEQKTAEEIYQKVFTEELKIKTPDFAEADFMSPKAVRKNDFKTTNLFLDDPMTEYTMLYEKKVPVAMGCVSFDGMHYRIEPVAVLPEYRHKGYGDFIVRLMLDKIIRQGAQNVQTLALKGTEGFFEYVGYHVIGEPVEWEGSEWVPMELDMKDIVSHCGGH